MQPRDPKGRFRSVIRDLMVPVWYALLTLAAASLANWISLSPLGFGVLVGLVLAGGFAALVLWGTARKRGWPSRSHRSGQAAVAAATAWSMLWVLLPWGTWLWPLVTLGLVLLGLCGRRWWAARALPYTPPAPAPAPAAEPEPEPEPDPEPEPGRADRIRGDWDEYVNITGGPLPGAQLVPVEEKRHTVIFDLGFVRGKQALFHANNNIELIASGLDVDEPDLIFEAHPTHRSASRARLTVITGTPLGKSVPYPGPQLDRATGEIRVGPFTDGEDTATWRAFTDNSFHGGHICGVKGSGKSRVADVVVHSLLADGRTVVWYGDPQQGASSAALSAHSDWVTRDLARIKAMLEAAVVVMEHREMENAADGLDGFTPSAERPALLIVIDESATACRDAEVKALMMSIAEKGRKTGVALLTLSQQLDLPAFGGEESLRNNIIGGNLFMLHTTTRNTKDLIGGVTAGVDPSKLPPTPGYAYRIARPDKDGNISGRSAPFRAYHLGDAKGASKEWFDQIPLTARAQLDQGAVSALDEAGTGYAERHVTAERDLARMKAIIERRRKGLPDNAFGRETGAVDPAPTRPKLADHSAFNVPVFGGGTINTEPGATGAATAVLTRDPLTALPRAARNVYEQLQLGWWRPAEICDATDYGDSWVDTQLKALINAGLAVKVSQGHYHAVGHEDACRKPGCAS